MAAAIQQLAEEEGSKGADGRHTYYVTGAATKLDAYIALEAGTDTIDDDGLYRQPVHAVEIPGRDGEWIGTVTYGPSDFTPPQDNDTAFNFDTGGSTAHIVASIPGSPRNTYPDDGTAPATHGLIGITKNGVEGVDIVSRQFSFGYRLYVASSKVTQEWIGKLFNLTGKTNDAPWTFTDTTGVQITLQEGEGLFLGASGSARGRSAGWEITLKFAGSPNRDDLVVGPITGITKNGWDYLWVLYADDDDDTAKALTKKPIGVYVDQVYEDGDFNDLEPPA